MKKKLFNLFVPNLLVILLSTLGFYLFLKLQGVASEYLPSNNGIASVYLPAGVVFLAILIGRVYGALGILLALIPSYMYRFPHAEILVIVGMVLFSMSVQLIVVNIFLAIVKVGNKLDNLTFAHVITLGLIFSLSHSFCHYLNLLIIAKYQVGWFESKLTLSTLLGIFIILFTLWLVSKVIRNFGDFPANKSTRN